MNLHYIIWLIEWLIDRIDSLKAHHDWTFDLQKTGGVGWAKCQAWDSRCYHPSRACYGGWKGWKTAQSWKKSAMGVGKVGRLRSHGKSQLWIEGQKWSKCVKLWNWGWYLGYLPGWGCHSTISWNMIVAVWVRLCWLWGLISPRNMTGGTGWSGWTWGPKRCFWHFQNGLCVVYHGYIMVYQWIM